MNIQNEKNTQLENKTEDYVKVDNSRRNIAKAGVITPVIMSLTSSPLWAVDCTVSGMLSGNLSVNYDATCSLPGLAIAYWINNPKNICDPLVTSFGSDTNFNDVFNFPQQIFASGTILEVLNGSAPLSTSLCTGTAEEMTQYNDNIKLAAAQFMASWLSAVNLAPHYANNTNFDGDGVIAAFVAAAGLSTTAHDCNLNITTLSDFTADFAALDNAYP